MFFLLIWVAAETDEMVLGSRIMKILQEVKSKPTSEYTISYRPDQRFRSDPPYGLQQFCHIDSLTLHMVFSSFVTSIH